MRGWLLSLRWDISSQLSELELWLGHECLLSEYHYDHDNYPECGSSALGGRDQRMDYK